jgi:hypothetical protein
MEILRAGSRPSGKGPNDWFTGSVRIDPLFNPFDPARAQGASVTFEPAARTAWRTHLLGQTLIVTAGLGRAQRWVASRGRRPVRPGRKALARRLADRRHESYRHSGADGRQGGQGSELGLATIKKVAARPSLGGDELRRHAAD